MPDIMDVGEGGLTSLALTHVYYDASDIFGLPSAFLALVPQALIVSYVALILSRREIEMGYCFSGQLVCEALNWVLKRIIRQDRPQHVIGAGKGYGMPSSHSQFMGYFAIYTVLWLRYRCHRDHRDWNLVRMVSSTILATAVCASRVYLAYHTTEQVLVGFSTGVLFGAIWFVLLSGLRQVGLVDWILDHPMSRFFWLKDTMSTGGLKEEWKRWHDQRRKGTKIR